MTQMKVSMKQRQTRRHREHTCDCQVKGWVGEQWTGDWGWQMQTIIYRMDKQGLASAQRNNIQYLAINHNGKECLDV